MNPNLNIMSKWQIAVEWICMSIKQTFRKELCTINNFVSQTLIITGLYNQLKCRSEEILKVFQIRKWVCRLYTKKRRLYKKKYFFKGKKRQDVLKRKKMFLGICFILDFILSISYILTLMINFFSNSWNLCDKCFWKVKCKVIAV